MNTAVNHPTHYNEGASLIARPALAALGIEHYEDECIEVLEQRYPWTLKNSYAFTAAVYLWRCEQKETLRQDLEKALWYLNRGMTFMATTQPMGDYPAAFGNMSKCAKEVRRLLGLQPEVAQ